MSEVELRILAVVVTSLFWIVSAVAWHIRGVSRTESALRESFTTRELVDRAEIYGALGIHDPRESSVSDICSRIRDIRDRIGTFEKHAEAVKKRRFSFTSHVWEAMDTGRNLPDSDDTILAELKTRMAQAADDRHRLELFEAAEETLDEIVSHAMRYRGFVAAKNSSLEETA